MLKETILVFAAFVVLASATQVQHCGTGLPYESADVVKITGCEAPPCKLKRRTKAGIELKFTPDRDIPSLITSVHATVLRVPLPFVGVDGTDACENIYNTDGSKAGCPLKKGVEYVYKNEFPILEIYPRISVLVYYALTEGNDVVTCFEVPSRIV